MVRKTIRFDDDAERDLAALREYLNKQNEPGAPEWTDTRAIAYALAVTVRTNNPTPKPPAKARRRPR